MLVSGSLGTQAYTVRSGEDVPAGRVAYWLVPAEWPAFERLLTKLYPEFVGTSVATGRAWVSVFDAETSQFVGVVGQQHGYRRSPWYRRPVPGLMADLVLAAHALWAGPTKHRSERCHVHNAGSIKVMQELGMGGRVGVHGDVAAQARADGPPPPAAVAELARLYDAALPAYLPIRARARAALAGITEANWVPRRMAWLDGEPVGVTVERIARP